jgi:hypothetical protein
MPPMSILPIPLLVAAGAVAAVPVADGDLLIVMEGMSIAFYCASSRSKRWMLRRKFLRRLRKK